MNCGVDAHSDDCLCDVEVDEPTPINFSLNEVLGSEYLTDDQWSHPWDANKVVDYAETLLVAYDEYRRRHGKMTLALTLEERLEVRDDLAYQIRALTMRGESMVDIPAILNMTHQEMWEAMRNGRPPFYEQWGDLEWLKFEAALGEFPHGIVKYRLACMVSATRKEAMSRQHVLGNLAEKLYGRKIVSAKEEELAKGRDA